MDKILDWLRDVEYRLVRLPYGLGVIIIVSLALLVSLAVALIVTGLFGVSL